MLDERRMENWRRVVRDVRREPDAVCALWARWYVALRTGVDVTTEPARPGRTASAEVDGWLIEAAVRTLPVFEERQILKFWYVMRYPKHWICSKLHIRRPHFELVLARAEKNLQQVLAKLEGAATIHSNNLHAGTDPSAPSDNMSSLGEALSKKSEAALSD